MTEQGFNEDVNSFFYLDLNTGCVYQWDGDPESPFYDGDPYSEGYSLISCPPGVSAGDPTDPAGSSGGGHVAIDSDHTHINDVMFSGDGATTSFELPAAPFDEFSVQVHIAAALGLPNPAFVHTRVTLSGPMLTTMTFASPPAAGVDNILVDIVAAVA